MTQKVLKVGSSAAVTIPKKTLDELGLKIGDSVSVTVDVERRVVSIQPGNAQSAHRDKITKLTADFIDRYREDMEALAK